MKGAGQLRVRNAGPRVTVDAPVDEVRLAVVGNREKIALGGGTRGGRRNHALSVAQGSACDYA